MSARNAAEAPLVRVATWNIHGFIGEGPRPDPARTFRLIESFDADILALQEVDGRAHLRRLPLAFERLAGELGPHLVEARLLGGVGLEYGHVLWSRRPIRSRTIHRLPGPGVEPRAAIDAMIEFPQGTLRVIAAHFGLDPRARRRQAGFVRDLVRTGEPTIVLGDFNEWGRRGPVHRTLSTVLPIHRSVPTWPVRRPFAALDRFYGSPEIELRAIEAPKRAGPGSDHLPLLAEIDF